MPKNKLKEQKVRKWHRVCQSCGYELHQSKFKNRRIKRNRYGQKMKQGNKWIYETINSRFCQDCRDEYHGKETSRPRAILREPGHTIMSMGEETLAERLEKRRGRR